MVAPVAAALIERYGWREAYVFLGAASAIGALSESRQVD
jgi:hypothetical protein